jgi:hypothetical protein
MHRKDDDHNSHKLMMIPNQIKTQKKKKKKKKEKKQLLLYESKSSPLPPAAATASTNPATMWTRTTTLSYLDWNYDSGRHLDWNLWNCGTLELLLLLLLECFLPSN